MSICYRNFPQLLNSHSIGDSVIPDSTVAALFWGLYERHEQKLIKKYLRSDLDVIELGACIGGTTAAVIGRLGHRQKYIIVEANPQLFYVLTKTVKLASLENTVEIKVMNLVVSYAYNGQPVDAGLDFDEGLLGTRVSSQQKELIKGTTLSTLRREHQISNYTLVCDIEGGEIDFIINYPNELSNVRQLFIELHSTGSSDGIDYSPGELCDHLVKRQGFRLVQQSGAAYYFEK